MEHAFDTLPSVHRKDKKLPSRAFYWVSLNHGSVHVLTWIIHVVATVLGIAGCLAASLISPVDPSSTSLPATSTKASPDICQIAPRGQG